MQLGVFSYGGIAGLLFFSALTSFSTAYEPGTCHFDSDCSSKGYCDSLHEEFVVGTCICFPGFWGDYCEKTCPILCQNGALCMPDPDDLDNFICDCRSHLFEGPLCDTPVGGNGGTPSGPPTSSNDSDVDGDAGVSGDGESDTTPSPPSQQNLSSEDRPAVVAIVLSSIAGVAVAGLLLSFFIIKRIRPVTKQSNDSATTAAVVKDVTTGQVVFQEDGRKQEEVIGETA